MIGILSRYDLRDDAFLKNLKGIWEGGANQYFANLRRIKLFLNAIAYSLEKIGAEVNIEDFIRLELIRHVLPSLYEQIYRSPDYFYDGDFAFETSFKRRRLLNDDEAKQERDAFYEKIKSSIPDNKQYVIELLERLFPNFATYRKRFGARGIEATDAERDKRIFHPRFFRQYFLLKVPPELFRQKEFNGFVASISKLNEDAVAAANDKLFQSIVKEDFKRWHFMHLVEGKFNGFGPETARGLCRGMARNSGLWALDAFQLMTAVRCTKDMP